MHPSERQAEALSPRPDQLVMMGAESGFHMQKFTSDQDSTPSDPNLPQMKIDEPPMPVNNIVLPRELKDEERRRMPKSMVFVTVRVPAWSPLVMTLDAKYSVRTVKAILTSRYHLDHDMMLYYMGQQLADDSTLEEANIVKGAKANIYVVPSCGFKVMETKDPVAKAPNGVKIRAPPGKPFKSSNRTLCSGIKGGASTGCPTVVPVKKFPKPPNLPSGVPMSPAMLKVNGTGMIPEARMVVKAEESEAEHFQKLVLMDQQREKMEPTAPQAGALDKSESEDEDEMLP